MGVSAWTDFGLGGLARKTLERRATNSTPTPAPIVAGASQFWDGNDGPWSSFELQVGNHPQQVRAFPATSLPFINVIPTYGCVTGGPSDCADFRGGLFSSNQSLTWVPDSIYNIGIDDNLGLDTTAHYGFDTVTIGWEGSGGPTTTHSIISEGAAYNFMFGLLGINPQPTNFTDFSDPQPSFIEQLKSDNLIPVLGYGYTAGAQYRNNHAVFGSLVFGGYDSSRFDNSSMLTYPMSEDVQRDLVVAIQGISSGQTEILSQDQGIYAFIDTSVSQLYLPLSVCQQFEQVFGIQWNSSISAYTINSTQHQTNQQNNPQVTFTLGSTTTSNDSISITFPYAAFDKNLSFPFVENGGIPYFPLNRSQDTGDITLGRAFLQEAYLIADYQNLTMTLAPCVWPTSFQQDIRVIGQTTPSSSSGISGGAIAGIAVGAAALIALLLLALWLLNRRKKTLKRRQAQELDAKDTARLPEDASTESKDGGSSPGAVGGARGGRPMEGPHQLLDSGELHEMAAPHKMPYSELSAMNDGHPAMWKPGIDRSASEVEGSPAPVYEMPGSEAYSELETPTGTGTWNTATTATTGGAAPASQTRPSPALSPSPAGSSGRINTGNRKFSWQRGSSMSGSNR
ncbi:MAG: hypothetical protein M1821_006349 [Bathelium mastoideum]|nr:MAG: hypothetical protein M1821_006349 [Bathelium mastoideum]